MCFTDIHRSKTDSKRQGRKSRLRGNRQGWADRLHGDAQGKSDRPSGEWQRRADRLRGEKRGMEADRRPWAREAERKEEGEACGGLNELNRGEILYHISQCDNLFPE